MKEIEMGYWVVDCCCQDAWQVLTERDLEDARWRVEDEDIHAKIYKNKLEVFENGCSCQDRSKCRFNPRNL